MSQATLDAKVQANQTHTKYERLHACILL